MVACINFLAAVANVIVDDLLFFAEPYFEDGPIAQAAASAVANGVAYLSAAGNLAQRHYQGTYVNSGDGLGSHQISPGNNSFNVTGSTVTVVLQWSNRFGFSSDDYDLCLAGETPSQCASSNIQQNGNDDPIEMRTLSCSTGCSLQVRLISGSPQMIELNCFRATLASVDQVIADSVVGHAAATSVLAIGAIAASDLGNDTIECFSSRGPSTIAFSLHETRQKPDVAAIDGVSVSGAGGVPTPFFGTSAAASHAVAVSALDGRGEAKFDSRTGAEHPPTNRRPIGLPYTQLCLRLRSHRRICRRSTDKGHKGGNYKPDPGVYTARLVSHLHLECRRRGGPVLAQRGHHAGRLGSLQRLARDGPLKNDHRLTDERE